MVINQLIQSNIFQLLSMLICIGVVVYLFVRRSSRGESETVDERIRLLNTLYISGILTFIIIELLTAICMDNSNSSDILSFVSFAATLSSLILSVVAIIFTIVSGNRGESQYQKLDKVSDNVKESLTKFSEKTKSLDDTIDRFKEVAEYLSKQIHDVYDKITGIETPINEMREQILTSDSGLKDKKTKNGVNDEYFRMRISDFISHGSFSGNLALYACVLSNEKKRQFTMSQIRDNEDDEAYKFGYIIASSALGLVSVKVYEGRRIQVLSCYPELKGLLDQALEAFISNSTDDIVRGFNQSSIDKIKQFFE